MALNPGFQRFEGSAYFGYDLDGEGHEVVVVIGKNIIEIRDTSDNTLSQWIPGTYTCNDQIIPYRAYFHGEEWLAPQDAELQSLLDQFIVRTETPVGEYSQSSKKLGPVVTISLIILALAVISFFALRPMTKQLLSPAIRASLDEDVIVNFESDYEICNPDLNAASHDKIVGTLATFDFVVRPTITQNYARLPSGRLIINAEFLQNLGDVDSLSSLLQLAQNKNDDNDAAAELISKMPLTSRFQFLANAEISQGDLEAAWGEYAKSEAFPASSYKDIEEPLGNFNNLSTKLGWPEGDYPSAPSEVILTDEEWLSLFTFCEKE